MSDPEADDPLKPENPWAAPEIPTEIDERLSRLEQKAQKMRESRENAASKLRDDRAKEHDQAYSLGIGLQAGYILVGFPLLGVAVGWALDRQLHTETWKGLLATLGMFVGVFLVVAIVSRRQKD